MQPPTDDLRLDVPDVELPEHLFFQLAELARASTPTPVRAAAPARRAAKVLASAVGIAALSTGGAWAIGAFPVPGLPDIHEAPAEAPLPKLPITPEVTDTGETTPPAPDGEPGTPSSGPEPSTPTPTPTERPGRGEGQGLNGQPGQQGQQGQQGQGGPAHPVHPTHPAHPTHPVHPTHPGNGNGNGPDKNNAGGNGNGNGPGSSNAGGNGNGPDDNPGKNPDKNPGKNNPGNNGNGNGNANGAGNGNGGGGKDVDRSARPPARGAVVHG